MFCLPWNKSFVHINLLWELIIPSWAPLPSPDSCEYPWIPSWAMTLSGPQLFLIENGDTKGTPSVSHSNVIIYKGTGVKYNASHRLHTSTPQHSHFCRFWPYESWLYAPWAPQERAVESYPKGLYTQRIFPHEICMKNAWNPCVFRILQKFTLYVYIFFLPKILLIMQIWMGNGMVGFCEPTPLFFLV